MKSLMWKLTNSWLHLRNSSSQVGLKRAFQRSQNVWIPPCVNCCRNAVTSAVTQDEDSAISNKDIAAGETIKKRKKKKKVDMKSPVVVKAKPLSGGAQTVLEFVAKHCGTTNRAFSGLLPKQYLKSTIVLPVTVYLIDQKEAKNFSSAIKAENPDKEAPVVEINPGLGLLTSELIEDVGFKHITCLEDHAPLANSLINRLHVTVIDCNIDDLPRHNHLDKHDGGERINSVLTSIRTGEHNSEVTSPNKRLHLIGAIPHISIINFLIRSYVTKRVFFEDDLPWSGVTIFTALGAKAAHICAATPVSGMVAYRPTSVFCQTLFTFKEIGSIPRKAFIPWQADEDFGTKTRKMKIDNLNVLKLMKIDINYEVQEKIGKDNLFVYWYFVRQHLYARKNRVIPELERWIPGCGVRLIKQGFTIYTQFGSLKPDEILQLYLQFVSWPEFANSSFLNAVEKFQTRLELTEEDSDNK